MISDKELLAQLEAKERELMRQEEKHRHTAMIVAGSITLLTLLAMVALVWEKVG